MSQLRPFERMFQTEPEGTSTADAQGEPEEVSIERLMGLRKDMVFPERGDEELDANFGKLREPDREKMDEGERKAFD